MIIKVRVKLYNIGFLFFWKEKNNSDKLNITWGRFLLINIVVLIVVGIAITITINNQQKNLRLKIKQQQKEGKRREEKRLPRGFLFIYYIFYLNRLS